MTDRDFRIRLALLWLVVSLLMVVLVRENIATNVLPDADDYMRLQQVRDLLGGQSWFDLHQYRYVPPVGAPMHWSRLVDIPIATLILIFRPLVGGIAAERLAEIIVPLLTLGCVMALLATITRRLAGERPAFLAAALIPTSFLLLMQFQPLRIDHHGWQVATALAMSLGLLDTRERRGGLLAGIAAATWLTISLEGLPFTAAVGGLFALRWWRKESSAGLEAYGWSLAAAALLYFIAMQPAAAWSDVHCDSVSFPYLGGLVVAAIGIGGLCRLKPPRALRLPALGMVAIAAAAAIPIAAPTCHSGPFAQLDPLVQNLWYQNVLEGLPVWKQPLNVAMMILGFPLIGLIGAWRARAEASDEVREDWTTLILLQLASVLIAIAMQRTGAVENALALPGGAWAIARLANRAQEIERPVTRIVATAAAMLLLAPPTLPLLANVSFSHQPSANGGGSGGQSGCSLPANVAKLDALPPANIASTFDLSATIVSMTRHHVLATAHHRNVEGMKDLIVAYTRSPDVARSILKRRKIDYVVLCGDSNDVHVFTKLGPGGIVDRLSHGQKVDWLQPVPLVSHPQIGVWRVL